MLFCGLYTCFSCGECGFGDQIRARVRAQARARVLARAWARVRRAGVGGGEAVCLMAFCGPGCGSEIGELPPASNGVGRQAAPSQRKQNV